MNDFLFLNEHMSYHCISFHFIFLFKFTVLFSHCPQIAEASLGGQCLKYVKKKTKYALQIIFSSQVNKSNLCKYTNDNEERKS